MLIRVKRVPKAMSLQERTFDYVVVQQLAVLSWTLLQVLLSSPTYFGETGLPQDYRATELVLAVDGIEKLFFYWRKFLKCICQ